MEIDRRRVVIDLDGTIIESNDWDPRNKRVIVRPGAIELLEELSRKKYVAILWTTSGQGWVDRVFGEQPQLEKFFSQKYNSNNLPNMSFLDSVADLGLREELYNLMHGFMGGKYPPALGSGTLIDDSGVVQVAAKKYGFKWIDAGTHDRDKKPDDWAKRVRKSLRI